MARLDLFSQYITRTCSGATARRYVIAVRQFLGWFERYAPGKTLDKAPRDTLVQYTVTLLKSNYQTTTIRSHLAGIARYLKWLQDRCSVQIPDLAEPEIPKEKRKAVKDTLSSSVLVNYFHAASQLDEPIRTAALLLPCSGLRCSEMVTLPLACAQRVHLQMVDGTNKNVLTLRLLGKGGHERLVPLLDEGAEILVSYLRGWRRKHPNARWLFPGRTKGPMATRTLRRAVQQIRQPMGLSYTPHSMRRTYLTTLFRMGVDPIVIAKIAGHSNVQVLVNHYLQLDASDLAEAVHAKGGRLLKNPKGKEPPHAQS
jgi:site-specific recombinase XerD